MIIYRIGRVICRLFFKAIYRMEVIGAANVPAEGPVILCANHISYLDPPFVGTPLNRKVHYMAKAELFRIPLLGPLITNLGAFPVKRGGVGKETIRHALKLLEEGKVMGIFPEGTRGGSIGKKGAASLALKSGATVIPVAIVGNFKPFRKMKIVFGKPVDLTDFRKEANSEALVMATDRIMSAIRELIAAHSAK